MNASPYVIAAHNTGEVWAALEAVESAAAAGLRACGFVAYEAAPALDPAMAVHPYEGPLVWFLAAPPAAFAHGLVSCSEGSALILRLDGKNTLAVAPEATMSALSPTSSRREYGCAFQKIREHLGQGRTYQVNYTFPLKGHIEGEALDRFSGLCAAQGNGEYYYFDTGLEQVLCTSPELFFSLTGDRLLMRPMKGTRARGKWQDEDEAMAAELAASEKDRAENVMIVDMARNDLGRIAESGSVRVDALFTVERYETVWQMTSQVSATTKAGLPQIFQALFPCASVTGAPKVQTMRIIRELEPEPRGAYCGAAGWYGPGREGRFSVGIRTATIDKGTRVARYHVGSGITWSSVVDAEYAECLHKAAVVHVRRPAFDLLETLRWEDGVFFLLEGHLARMRSSAAYFGFTFNEEYLRSTLLEAVAGSRGPLRVRLLLERNGVARVEAAEISTPFIEWAAVGPVETVEVALAAEPVDPEDIFLYHKTTHRTVYARRKELRPELADVLLWNRKGEVTESTIANLVVQDQAGLWTPARTCGLLAGVLRERLLAQQQVRERVVRVEELEAARLWLINSVRGWIPVRMARTR